MPESTAARLVTTGVIDEKEPRAALLDPLKNDVSIKYSTNNELEGTCLGEVAAELLAEPEPLAARAV